MKPGLEQTCVVMHRHSPRFKFLFLVHLFFLLPVINNEYHAHSFQLHIETAPTVYHGDVYVVTRKFPIGVVHLYNIMYNIKYIKDCLETVAIATFSAWLFVLLLISGDVHPNPGPASTSSISSSSISSRDSSSFFNSMNFCKHLSFIHYNVQSIANKTDILSAELTDFDILAFSETWLHPDIHTNDLLIPEFMPPERKDRLRDRHGGVMIYVKDTLFYKRRYDLEPLNTECIWIEIHLNHTRILFGLFYRPPNSDMAYFSRIEDSISLALDTQVRNIIVTGDFNFNMLSDLGPVVQS